MDMAKLSSELDRIDEIENPEQQGYEAAPIICAITGVGAQVLLDSVYASPETSSPNTERDAGVIRWCKEQLK